MRKPPSLLSTGCVLSSGCILWWHVGQDGPEFAAAAIKAIFKDLEKSHRVTLRTQSQSGKDKWTQFEMWTATDAAGMQPAMLVSTLNVTAQRELELQLQQAQEQLLRSAGPIAC